MCHVCSPSTVVKAVGENSEILYMMYYSIVCSFCVAFYATASKPNANQRDIYPTTTLLPGMF